MIHADCIFFFEFRADKKPIYKRLEWGFLTLGREMVNVKQIGPVITAYLNDVHRDKPAPVKTEMRSELIEIAMGLKFPDSKAKEPIDYTRFSTVEEPTPLQLEFEAWLARRYPATALHAIPAPPAVVHNPPPAAIAPQPSDELRLTEQIRVARREAAEAEAKEAEAAARVAKAKLAKAEAEAKAAEEEVLRVQEQARLAREQTAKDNHERKRRRDEEMEEEEEIRRLARQARLAELRKDTRAVERPAPPIERPRVAERQAEPTRPVFEFMNPSELTPPMRTLEVAKPEPAKKDDDDDSSGLREAFHIGVQLVAKPFRLAASVVDTLIDRK